MLSSLCNRYKLSTANTPKSACARRKKMRSSRCCVAAFRKNSTTKRTSATAAETRHSAAATRARRRSIPPSSKGERKRAEPKARGREDPGLSVTEEERRQKLCNVGFSEERVDSFRVDSFFFLSPLSLASPSRFVRSLFLPLFASSLSSARAYQEKWTRAPRSPSRRSRWSP